MPLVLKDRVKETTTTISTGTYTLAGAVTGYQSFSVVGDGNTTYYTVTNGTDWEVGIGTYTASGTTLSRDTILASSNSGNAVSWGAGSKDVFLTYPAERSVYVDGAEIVPATSASYSGNVTTIQLRFSSTPGSVPTGASLSAGELVVNTADGKLLQRQRRYGKSIVASGSDCSFDNQRGSACQQWNIQCPFAGRNR